jgi:hypothetical protein
MIRGACTLQRLGGCLFLVVLLALPALAFAGRYQPEPQWLEAVRAPQPFLPYRLGVVEFKKGLSDEWREYLGDFRATLRGANYFQPAEAPRLRVEIEQGYQHGSSNEDGCKETPGTLALTYRFVDGEREVSRLSVTTQAPVSGDSNDWDAAMAGNLKFLLLELRKGQGDAQFAQAAGGIEARIREALGKGSNTGCTVGAVLARGFMATVEGTVAVVEGLGEVAGVALEVAASPQFQGALNTALAEQQQQRAQQQAFIDKLNAQAQAEQRAQAEKQREAQQRAAAERAQQQQAGREALAQQLADGIAYRNSQMSKTSDAATLQRLRRDNEAALQAAQQIGMRSRVDGMATQSTQAGFDQARTERAAEQQAEKQRIAEQARQQREREAEQRAEQQRIAAEQAEAERKRKAEEVRLAREREAEERRLAAERLDEERKQARREFHAAHLRGLRLAAQQCDGKDKPYRLVGNGPAVRLPEVIKHYSSCIKVHYEARCPGTPRGAGLRGAQGNFVGGGTGCLSAEGLMPQRLSCAAEDVIVETVEVTGCSG